MIRVPLAHAAAFTFTLLAPALVASASPLANAAADAAAAGPADVSFLLEAPAGGSGFVRVRNGHLARGDGRRLRLWGVNLTGAATLPPKEDAPRLASLLAGRGVNAVRLHFLDLDAPAGLLAVGTDSRSLDTSMLDRLDFFIAELKKRGIYTNLNLNVGRNYKPGDGVRDYELLGFAKALTYFDPRLLELQQEYARATAHAPQPYTGNEYRHEPAVAIVELVNENSLVESWFSGRLLGKKRARTPAPGPTSRPATNSDLTERYNAGCASSLPADELRRACVRGRRPGGVLTCRG